MKKTIISILVALAMLLMPSAKAALVTDVPKVTDHEKIKIYLFWASWCSHCHDFMEYFSDKYEDYSDYFEIVTFQVNDGNETNSVNASLMMSIKELFGQSDGSIPFIVVGDWYQPGFGKDGTEIIEKALAAYQNKKYKDIVAEAITKNKLNNDPKPMSEALIVAGIFDDENKSNSNTTEKTQETKKGDDTLVVVVVFAIIIAGFGGLYLYSRKN